MEYEEHESEFDIEDEDKEKEETKGTRNDIIQISNVKSKIWMDMFYLTTHQHIVFTVIWRQT